MKSVHSSDPSTKGIVGSTKRHIISRLNKATSYAKQLVVVLENRAVSHASLIDLLEARAYLAHLLGAFWMEKQRWEQCLQQFSMAKVVYTVLGKQAKRESFRDLISTTIEPSIRYAAYQSKLPRTTASDTIAIQYFPSDDNLRSEVTSLDPNSLTEKSTDAKTSEGTVQDSPQTISWRSRTVKLEDASISQALSTTATAENNLSVWLTSPEGRSASSKEKAANYDNVIIASQDAVDATKTAIDELSGEGVDQSDKRMQALQVTRTAVNYALVGWRVGRNRILCGTQDGLVFDEEESQASHSPENRKNHAKSSEESVSKRLTRLREQVVLYDAILQSVDSISELPGVAGDVEFVKELGMKRSYFQSLRFVHSLFYLSIVLLI